MKLSVGPRSSIEFEAAVRAVEQNVLANLEQRRQAIQRDGRFTAARIDSMRHGDAIHTIGLSCHPTGARAPQDTYALCINLSSVHGLGLRGFAFWSQSYVRGRSPGYLVYEAVTPSFRCTETGGIQDFLQALEPLFQAFDQGLQRGKPPQIETIPRMR
jgi:hypothetical protein